MDYCESNNLIPALDEDWTEAEIEYQNLFHNNRLLGI